MPKISMSQIVRIAAFCAATAAACAGILPTRADDGIFPPAAVAKPFIDFDGKGFLVRGQRTFLASGGLEYARIPRGLWRDRLLRVKRAGFNTVEIYLFWNYHEPREGQWDFTDNRDLDAFLKLCASLDLYVTVRVGPYVCAEWDSGGFPVWLRFKPNLGVREVNAEFEKYVDRYFDKVMPIVAANQIDRGGSVILVQLENEHPQGWGKEMPNAYFTHLRDKALSLGLEVPYFFSGLHHGADPAGRNPWDSAGRTNPWYTTEFWCDWFDIYGNPTPKATVREDRATWKILAYGGNGYNYYMIHGGTNFDHFNNNEDASSYDYGSAIGQAGDIRPIYYKFKRAALFATSFAPVLEDSTNATEQYKDAATNSAIRVTARSSSAGTILFLDNPTDAPVETQVKFADGEILPKAGPLRLEPGEIVPIVRDFVLAPGVTLERGIVRILGIAKQGQTTTLVIHGVAGSAAEMRLGVDGKTVSDLTPSFIDGKSNMAAMTVGGHTIHVISESSDMADRTYFVNGKTGSYVVCGFPYIGEADDSGGVLKLIHEVSTTDSGGTNAQPAVYGAGAAPLSIHPRPFLLPPRRIATALDIWETKSASDEANPRFDDKSWITGDSPLQMGSDGDDGAFAWYRTNLHAPAAGTYILAASAIGDRAIAFVDGKPVAPGDIHGNSIKLEVSSGNHALAIFTAHYGRDKMFGHLGPIDKVDPKGLTGPVFLRQMAASGGVMPISAWQYQMTDRRHSAALPPAAGPGWQPATVGQDVFKNTRGYAFFQATLPKLPLSTATGAAALHFESVDDNATVYLNGVKIGQHAGWSEAFDVPITATDLRPNGQPNILTVMVENTDGTGGISGPVSVMTYSYDAAVHGWKMRGGTANPLASGGFQPFSAAGAPAPIGPRLYRTTFSAAPPTATGPHPILRATFAGLSHGFMYLNGHNLGRYPEKIPVDGIYLPECWLNGDKANTLVILDEDGKAPSGVKIETEAAASRFVREVVLGN